MNSSVLQILKSDDFHVRVGFVATPAALRRLLQRSTEIAAIRQGLKTGILTEDMIRRFVDSLMRDFSRGLPFVHDLAISALAVALEKRGTDFAQEYLTVLAGLTAAEMSFSVRVAQECLKDRVLVSGNTRSDVQTTTIDHKTRLKQVEKSSVIGNTRTTIDLVPAAVWSNPHTQTTQMHTKLHIGGA